MVRSYASGSIHIHFVQRVFDDQEQVASKDVVFNRVISVRSDHDPGVPSETKDFRETTPRQASKLSGLRKLQVLALQLPLSPIHRRLQREVFRLHRDSKR